MRGPAVVLTEFLSGEQLPPPAVELAMDLFPESAAAVQTSATEGGIGICR